MQPAGRVCLAAAVAATIGFGIPPRSAAAACDGSSWIAGTVDVCEGVVVYRDYVHDDYGADTGAVGAVSTGTLSNPTGDRRYAGDPGANSADLVSLSFAREGGDLRITALLNSPVRDGAKTTLAVAFDTDADPSTGGGAWVPLGVSSAGWEEIHFFDTTADGQDEITGTIPLPPGNVWRVQAVTATTDGTVMNVAFRGTDETGTWFENRQAAALASGDVSAFGASIATADLDPSVTRPATVGPGYYERVYTSAFCIDNGTKCDGIDYAGVGGPAPPTSAFGQSFNFLGHRQPYGIYVPDRGAPHGLQLLMHGYSANHTSVVSFPGMQSVMGDGLNRILVVPLARGPEGFYSGYSEQDVLDVMEDVFAHYAVDRDRVFSGGYSMGGYGALRMATLHPDRFAGLVTWVGFPGDAFPNTPLEDQPGSQTGALGDTRDFFRNLRWVPGAGLYTGLDELVNVNQGLAVLEAWRNTGYPFVFFEHPVAEHFTLALADDWRKESDYLRDLVRVKNPPRVTFRTDTFVDTGDGDGNPVIRHDRAYWVSAIRGHVNPGFVDVDLTTHGCGGDVPFTEPVFDVGIDPVPWISEGARVIGGHAVAPGNRLSGTLGNVASLTVDLDAACLTAPVDLSTVGVDETVEITFVDAGGVVDTVTITP